MFKKLVNGELSLRLTFWVFGLLGFFIFFLLTSITHAGVLRHVCQQGVCPRNLIFYIATHFINLLMSGEQNGVMIYLGAHILLSASFAVYMYITLHGLWKASEAYEGPSFWTWMAKIILVCVAILSLKSIF